MSMEKYVYAGKPIKTFKFSNNGIYLNTKDLCNILDIKERPKGSVLSIPCLDLAGAENDFFKIVEDCYKEINSIKKFSLDFLKKQKLI